jgi:hypothetical protein
VADLTNCPLTTASFTEYHDGGSIYLHLNRANPVEVETVVEDGTTLADTAYVVDLDRGSLVRRVGTRSTHWRAGIKNVTVTYVAGYETLPANVEGAILDLLRIHYRPQLGGNYSPFDGGAGDVSATSEGMMVRGYFVPNRVVEMLGGDHHGPSIA